MNKLNTKNKIIASVILFPAVISALLFFVIMPRINGIKGMSADIEMKRIELEEKYLRGQSLKKLAENLKNIDAYLGYLDQIFINKDDVLKFVTSLEEIALTSNVSQKVNLTTDKEAGQNGYSKIPLQISTEGRFKNNFNYLSNIEKLNYYINITSLELSSTRTEPEIGQGAVEKIQMTIFADTFWK